MIAVRGAGQEARRVLRKEGGERLGHDVGKLVGLNPVPHVEEKMPARLQDAARLLVALDLVGKEHRAELAGHGIEASIRERQGQRIGLLPGDPVSPGSLAAA